MIMDHLSTNNKVLSTGFILLLELPWPPGPQPGGAPRQPWAGPPHHSFEQASPDLLTACGEPDAQAPWHVAGVHPDDSVLSCVPPKTLVRMERGRGKVIDHQHSPLSPLLAQKSLSRQLWLLLRHLLRNLSVPAHLSLRAVVLVGLLVDLYPW